MSVTQEATNENWIPLECNPEVFNLWAKKGGLILSQDHFVDVYGLDDDLLELVPRPVKAVILLCSGYAADAGKRKAEDERIKREGQPKLDKTVMWIKQTVRNACGTMALIHAIANSGVTFGPESPLQKFIIECEDLTPLQRADLFERSKLFASIHAESAVAGQSAPPPSFEHPDNNYTCFIAAPEEDIRKGKVQPERKATGIEAVQGDSGENDAEAAGIGAAVSGALGAIGTGLVGAVQGATAAVGGTLTESDEQEEDDETVTGMRLIELDGSRDGPIDHGPCNDLLKDVANYVKSRYLSSTQSTHFGMMALVGTSKS